jgi:hypothetical protein
MLSVMTLRNATGGGRALGLALCLLCGVGCDDPPKENPFAAPASAAKPIPKLEEAPKPKGPPEFGVDDQGPKVGYDRILIEKSDGPKRLEEALTENHEHIAGKELVVIAQRNAKTPRVAEFLAALTRHGATAFKVQTDTRQEYPRELGFTPDKGLTAPDCSVVSTILEDRGTAVWKLSGGTPSGRKRGFAGPDLTMTGDSLLRYGKACKDSDLLFVSANAEIEWGLTYDLAASATTLEETPFRRFVLLEQTPFAGRKVVR